MRSRKHERKTCIKVSVSPEEHAAIAEAARADGVSINQWCVYALALNAGTDLLEGFEELFEKEPAEEEAKQEA